MKRLTHRFSTICLLGVVLSGCGGSGGDGGNETQPPTHAKTWGTAEPIETNDDNNYGPALAMDANGNTIAVWTQDDGTRHNIWANRYVAGVGWGTAGPVEANEGNNFVVQVAMDANGNAIALWTQENGTTPQNAWTNRYTAGVGWGPEAPLKVGGGQSYGYNMAMSANGDAIVVWIEWDSTRTRNNLWARRYTVGVGWSTAAPIGSNEADNSLLYPKIAMDAAGNAIAVWGQENSMQGQSHIVASRYTVGVGWGTVTPIGPISFSDYAIIGIRIAMNASGDALILWGRCADSESSCHLWARRYVVGGAWEPAVLIRSIPNLHALEIAMDASSNAIAVWIQCNDLACDSPSSLWATRYVAGTGWSETAQPIGTEAQYQFPNLAMDPEGNAIVVWTQGDTTPSNILASRYALGTGWEPAVLIEANDGKSLNPQIAIDARGNAVAGWTQSDGKRTSIWANQFK